MSRPSSYRGPESPACENCKHVFVKWELQESCEKTVELFCAFDAPGRPRCGSSDMKESFFDYSQPDHSYRSNLLRLDWDRWAAGRRISPNGTCDEYGRRIK